MSRVRSAPSLLVLSLLAACADGSQDTSDTADTSDTGDTSDTADTSDTSDTGTGCASLGGQALVVDGNDTLVTDFGLVYDAEPRNWTIELWVEPAALPTGGAQVRLLDWTQGVGVDDDPRASQAYWVVDVTADHVVEYETAAAPLSAAGGDNVSTAPLGTHPLTVGAWSHVAVVSDDAAGEIRLYVDGELSGTEVASAWFAMTFEATHLLYVGGRGSMMFDGRLDEVRLWDTARTEAEIQDTMCDRIAFATAPAGLRDQFTFDDDTASDAGIPTTASGDPERGPRD